MQSANQPKLGQTVFGDWVYFFKNKQNGMIFVAGGLEASETHARYNRDTGKVFEYLGRAMGNIETPEYRQKVSDVMKKVKEEEAKITELVDENGSQVKKIIDQNRYNEIQSNRKKALQFLYEKQILTIEKDMTPPPNKSGLVEAMGKNAQQAFQGTALAF